MSRNNMDGYGRRRQPQEGNSLPALEFEPQEERDDNIARLRAYKPTNLILATGIAAVLIAVLWPPYRNLIQGNQFNAGFHFLFSPPNQVSHVDAPLLACILFGIALITGMAWAITRTFETDA